MESPSTRKPLSLSVMTPEPFTPRRIFLGCAAALLLLGLYAWHLGSYFNVAASAFWFAVSVAFLLTVGGRRP